MAMIEVKANVAFRDWKQGEVRAVDGDDPSVIGLTCAGYLKVLEPCPEESAPDDFVGLLDAHDAEFGYSAREEFNAALATSEPVAIEPKQLPSKRASRKKASSGEDHSEPAGSDPGGTTQSDSAGGQSVPADPAGS